MLKNLLLVFTILFVASYTTQVTVLTDGNFTEYINQHPYVFVKFYAPWCGHCKALIPEYEKLANLSEGKQYKVAKLDAAENTNISESQGVEGYPTLKFYAHGIAVNYQSGRTAEVIDQWIQRFLNAKIQTLSQDQIKQKIGTESFLLIQGVSDEQKAILEIAAATDPHTAYYYGESSENKLTLYLKNSQSYDFTGKMTVEEIKGWAYKQALPIIIPLNTKQAVKFAFETEEKLPALLLLKQKDFSEQSFKNLESFCTNHKDIVCSYVSEEHDIFKGVAKYLKVNGQTSVLSYLAFELKQGWNYPGDLSSLSSDKITNFITDIKEGKIQKTIDAEKQKKEKQIKYEHVVKLTKQTYSQTIKNNKVVFVEYYSPNCGHCVQFAPEYEKLAKQLKQANSDIIIAGVDAASESQIAEAAKIQGYPTLRLFIEGNELEYGGQRTSKAIIEFINQVKQSKLLTAASVEEIPKPSIAVYGIDENSPLKYLSILYTKYPVYQITQKDAKFRVEYHGKQVLVFDKSTQLNTVVLWLTDATDDIVVNIVAETASKRLTNALQNKIPILAIINRGDQATAQSIVNTFETYCKGKDEIVCGYAKVGDQDYDQFNKWVQDPKNEENRLLYIDTQKFEKYFYDGELTSVTPQTLTQFLKKIKNGEIKAQIDSPPEAQKKEETVSQTENVEQTKPKADEQTEL